MAKYILTEGVVYDFLVSIFDSILQHKQDRVKKVLQRDPELKKLYDKLSQDTDDIKQYFDGLAAKESPEFQNLRNYLRDHP